MPRPKAMDGRWTAAVPRLKTIDGRWTAAVLQRGRVSPLEGTEGGHSTGAEQMAVREGSMTRLLVERLCGCKAKGVAVMYRRWCVWWYYVCMYVVFNDFRRQSQAAK